MPPYLNTEPTPYRPGSAEAIERLQVALRHVRAAKMALTDLHYAPAAQAFFALESADPMDAVEDAISSVSGNIEELGGTPDMDSHYSGRQQAETFLAVLRAPLGSDNREYLRQMEQMARRMA